MSEDKAKKPTRRISDITPVRQPKPAAPSDTQQPESAPETKPAPIQQMPAQPPAPAAKPAKGRQFFKRFLLTLLVLGLIAAAALVYFGYVVEG